MTDFVVSIDRHLPAPPERVYAAWTDPAVWAKWVWAGIGSDPVASIDLRPGGAYRVCTTVKGDLWCFRGVYEALDPPTSLRCTLIWEADVGYPPGTEHLEITLAPTAEGTHMAFRHRDLPHAIAVKGHTDGWAMAFEGLAALLLANP